MIFLLTDFDGGEERGDDDELQDGREQQSGKGNFAFHEDVCERSNQKREEKIERQDFDVERKDRRADDDAPEGEGALLRAIAAGDERGTSLLLEDSDLLVFG